jgi:hypothetical protein
VQYQNTKKRTYQKRPLALTKNKNRLLLDPGFNPSKR